MKNKVFALFVFIAFICLLSGCNDNKYNAVIYNNATEWISEEFLKENRVKAYYPNEDHIEYEDGYSPEYIYDEESPAFRTFIIQDEEEFKRIFSKYEGTIDFENEIVLLYIFPATSSRDYYIKKMDYENQVLTVQIKKQSRQNNKADGDLPSQRCLMIKMEKLEIDSVNFIKA